MINPKHWITSSALRSIVTGIPGTIVPRTKYYRFLRYIVAFLFIIASYGAKVSLALKRILTSYIVEIKNNK
jgi:hypothetical protein